ncbi:MAG: hypothetical protein SO442_05925, partial [Prevotella sp.]|nr:hypothetical protein [Prevotella sp.]
MKHSAIANAPAKLLLAATLLLSGSANIMAQPKSSTTTSYTRYSEWMANSLYDTKDTKYHYDYSLVFEAMMDTYLTYHNDANSKLDATNVLNSVNNYITTIDGGNDYKNAYQKKDGSKSTQLDYVRPLRFYMRYHKLFPKTTLNKYDEIISNVLNHMSDGTFERL